MWAACCLLSLLLDVGKVAAATLTYPAVLASTASSSASSCTASTWSATLTVETYDVTGDITFKTRAFCFQGTIAGGTATRAGAAWTGCSYPGPTIELCPGDSFSLTVTNSLPVNPAGEDTTMNSMHSPNSVNVHTHGLHIDPLVDNVFDTIAPGASKTYAYKVPANHQPGLFWYHDHTHGSSALRVMGGLVGAIVVKPLGTGQNIPASIYSANAHVLVLTAFVKAQYKDTNGLVSQGCGNANTCDPTTQGGDCTEGNKASSTSFSPFRLYSWSELNLAAGSDWDTTVTLATPGNSRSEGSWTYNENEKLAIFTNGQFEPSLSGVKTGQAVTLRIASATGGEEFKLTCGGQCSSWQIIAWDGVYLTAPHVKTTSQTVFLQAGSRVDLQVVCSGNCEIKAGPTKIVQITTSASGSDYATATSGELGAIIRPYYLSDLTSATVDVTYANHVSQGSRPQSTCGGANIFWWGGGSDCSHVAPYGASQPSSTDTKCPFGFYAGSRGNDPAPYVAANKLVTYIGDGKTDGEVNEWSIYGLGNSKHPLHLHVHHMQIVGYDCVSGSPNCATSGDTDEKNIGNWVQVGEWRDIFPTFEGRIIVRFRATDFPGETMLHCHFLRHEDLGMMDSILVMDGYRSGGTPPTSAEAGAGAADTTNAAAAPGRGADATTPAPTMFKVAGTMTLLGMSEADWTSAAESAFISAVAALFGKEAADVTVTGTSAARRRRTPTRRRMQSTTGLKVDYEVAGFESAEAVTAAQTDALAQDKVADLVTALKETDAFKDKLTGIEIPVAEAAPDASLSAPARAMASWTLVLACVSAALAKHC